MESDDTISTYLNIIANGMKSDELSSIIPFETASNYAKAKSWPEKHCSSLMEAVPIQEAKAKLSKLHYGSE